MRKSLYKMSDNELSLIVFNTEYLYDMIEKPNALVRLLRSMYQFTNKQLDVLKQDIAENSLENS